MAKQTTDKPPVKNEVVAENSTSNWNPGAVYWGLLVILVGSLLLLDSLDVINIQLNNLWNLWPMAIIGVGIALLRPRNFWSKLLTWLLIVALLVVAMFVALYPSNTITTSQSSTSDTLQAGISDADITLHTGPGDIKLSSDDVTSIVDAELDSDIFELKRTTTTRGTTQFVTIESIARNQFNPRNISNNLSVSLTEKIPVKLNINTGGSRISGDLSNTKLSDLTVKAGASDINLTLPDPANDLTVRLDVGVTKTTLRIPKDAAVRVKSDTGLTETTFEGLDDKGEGVYESPDFNQAAHKITIEAKMGVSTFKITRY